MMDNLPKVIIEKRKHRMFVTRNTEYHLKNGTCVGIRSRSTGDWLMHARALGARLIGTISSHDKKNAKPVTWLLPEVGDNLILLSSTGVDIVTTKVRGIHRPPIQALKYYLPLS
jgi:hypothetical protein